MMNNSATAEGTAAFAARFPNLPGNYRQALGLSISSIGIGTYLGESDAATDAAYEEAIRAALLGGVNLIDTAVNYRFQRSERVIGKVMREMVAAGEIRREEVVVATKGGYLAFDGEMPPDPAQWFERTYRRTGIIGPGDLVAGSHCMTPRYLDAMIETSRRNLGLDTIDIYYLHNPETQLTAVTRAEFRQRMKSAFDLLELKVDEGKINWYGTATWNCYRIAADQREYVSLADMAAVAQEIAGSEHHFRVIQLPYNLAMPEALTLANHEMPGGRKVNTLAASDMLGMMTCASASLLQGQLTRGLPKMIAEVLAGMESDAQRALQFVRSTPGVTVALTGMSSPEHVKENLATAKHPPAPYDEFTKLFKHDE